MSEEAGQGQVMGCCEVFVGFAGGEERGEEGFGGVCGGEFEEVGDGLPAYGGAYLEVGGEEGAGGGGRGDVDFGFGVESLD